MILFTIINKKEQARNLRQKYFHSCDTLYNNQQKEQAINLRQKYFRSYDPFYNNKEKGKSNKLAPESFSFL